MSDDLGRVPRANCVGCGGLGRVEATGQKGMWRTVPCAVCYGAIHEPPQVPYVDLTRVVWLLERDLRNEEIGLCVVRGDDLRAILAWVRETPEFQLLDLPTSSASSLSVQRDDGK